MGRGLDPMIQNGFPPLMRMDNLVLESHDERLTRATTRWLYFSVGRISSGSGSDIIFIA